MTKIENTQVNPMYLESRKPICPSNRPSVHISIHRRHTIKEKSIKINNKILFSDQYLSIIILKRRYF